MGKTDTSKIRLLAVEAMIRRGRLITASQILSELDLKFDIQVDRKTIYDDIRAIDRFVPVETISGKYGGFRMVDVLNDEGVYTMIENQDKNACPYNNGVICGPVDPNGRIEKRCCEICGWNPQVAADRLKNFCRIHHVALPRE